MAPHRSCKDRVSSLATLADPLPQALVLTAIVISFALTAVLLAIALRAHAEVASDHVDGDAGRERG
jgi:multicomponent K+:H+ antiporter subunit C